MCHWTAQTALTVTDVKEAQEMFQQGCPELAITFPYLMHGILSIAAIHLSRIQPEHAEKWMALSTRHQHRTLEQYRTVLQDITRENCTAVFLTATMLFMNATSVLSQPQILGPAIPSRPQISIGDIVGFFLMTRGVRDVLYPVSSWLTDPRLTCLLHKYTLEEEGNYPLPEEMQSRFKLLNQDLLRAHTGHHDSSKEACHFALKELELIYRDVVHLPSQHPDSYSTDFTKRKDLELGHMMKWTTNVSVTFVNLIRDKNVASLVLVAYWVVLFRHVGEKWFLDGWVRNVMRLIKEALKDEEKQWTEWPETYFGQS